MSVHRSSTLARTVSALPFLALAIALPHAAHAQQAAAESATAASEAAVASDIVVTATRRAELAKDVPVAVSAISGSKLDALNSSGLDVRFLSSRVPSLQIESSFGRTFPRFYIRGLGNTDFDPNAAQPVSVVYDDVALENPMLKSFPVFDLAGVQVLRGPQGTLFGRNTPAGVIKLDSARPGDRPGGYGSVQWGTYNTVNAEAALNLPLGGGLAFRAAGLLQRRDNWVTNTAATASPGASPRLEGYRDLAGRFQLGWTSGDDATHILANLHLRDMTGTPRLFRAGLFQQGSNLFTAGFDPARAALDGFTSQSLSQWGANLRFDHHFAGLGTLYIVSAYEHAKVESTGDIDGGNVYTFPPLALNQALFPVDTGGLTRPGEFSHEVRFVSDEHGGLRLQGGAYVFNQLLTYREFDYAGPPYTSRAASLDQDIEHRNVNENYGFFVSGDYRLERLTLRAGVRYSHDAKHDRVWGYAPGFAAAQVPADMRVTGSDVTWDASATYAASPTVNVYARVATGYLGPAIQDRVTFGSFQNSAPKQTTISVEGGIKGLALDHKISFAFDGYYNETKNLQVTAVGGASNSARLLSAAKVLGSGVEAELEARPTPNFSLTASGSYNFTRIKDANLVVAVCGALCTVTNRTATVNGSTVAFVDGNPLPQAPRWVSNLTARYDLPLGDSGKLYLLTDWAYRSKINYFLYAAKEFTGRSLTEGGVRIGFQTRDGLDVAVYGRNILNQIRAVSAIDFNNLTGMINDPRIWGVSLRKAF